MTVDQIERHVEHEMDILDAAFLRGKLTEGEYNSECDALDKWADDMYKGTRDYD